MKASTELQARITEAVSKYDTWQARQDYRELRIPRAESVKDINRRYRFDCYWIAVGRDRTISDAVTAEDLNDENLYTVLKSAIKPL